MVSTVIDIDAVREQLVGRRDACFARLVDAVSELYALHSVSPDEIRMVIEATIRAEAQPDGLQAVLSELALTPPRG
jgi:hypothetical protein